MSERQYAAHAGISRGAVQKAKAAGRLALHPDGSIDAAASDRRRAETTDPAQSRRPPEGAGDGSGGRLLQARTLNEIAKAQERQLRVARAKGEVVDRDRAIALVFRLARQERDAWVTWPARVAALMAADLTTAIGEAAGVTVETAVMQQILEGHVRDHLAELAEPRLDL